MTTAVNIPTGAPELVPARMLNEFSSLTWPRTSNSYPWLKGHGYVEAGLMKHLNNQIRQVSMAERSWLH